MTITSTPDGDKLTLALEGRLDTTTAPDLESDIKNLDGGTSHLVLDLSQLVYISSAGLRVVLAAQKQMTTKGGSLTLTGVQPAVLEVFEVTGFTDILTIQ